MMVLLGLLLILPLMTGCNSYIRTETDQGTSFRLVADPWLCPTRLEMDYGTSFKLAKFNQILNPDAEKNLEPVIGLDADPAQKIMDRYYKSFETPPQKPTYSINIGGIAQ